MSRTLLRRCLPVGAIIVGTALVPGLLLAGRTAYYFWVPRYSAVGYFDDFGFNLRLDLFLTQDDARDSGRYVSVIAGLAYNTFNIPGPGWSRRARTSIYRIDDRRIAVLSPLGHDYEVTLKPFAFAPVVSDAGDKWQYLGAFDFAFPPGERPHLYYFDSQLLAECIPMGTDRPDEWTDLPRAPARRTSCPTADRRPPD
jgi:hypothetical protein